MSERPDMAVPEGDVALDAADAAGVPDARPAAAAAAVPQPPDKREPVLSVDDASAGDGEGEGDGEAAAAPDLAGLIAKSRTEPEPLASEPVAAEPPAETGEARTGRRQGAARISAAMAVSILLHLAVFASFISVVVPGGGTPFEVAGKKEEGPTMAGDADTDARRTPPQETAIDVTLVAPPTPTATPTPQPPPQPQPRPKPETEAPRPDTPDVLSAPGGQGVVAPPPPEAAEPPVPAPAPVPDAQAEAMDAARPVAQPPESPDQPANQAEALQTPQQEQQQPAQPQQPQEQVEAAPADVPVPSPRPAPPAPPAPPAQRPARESATASADRDTRRGALGGIKDGTAASTAKGAADAGSGNAAASNYPGEIARKLQAALRYPPAAAREKLTGEAKVRFTVEGEGGVRDATIVSTSGSDILDEAALAAVREAAPFPPIPVEAGLGEWSFTVTLAFGR